ncbi:MAG: SulP family inorganic anion transporter [Saprospiraceae bacterium]
MDLKKYIPILEWLPSYTKSYFKSDLAAGLTVWVMLVPQGMAYALLAGMPPIYGLYGGLIPLFIYAILGTSRQMSIGPVAISALLVLAGLSQLAEPASAEYISLAILTGLLVGIVQLIAGVVRLGFVANFLSHPVIAGFTSAAAIIIAVSQLKYLLGIEIPRLPSLGETIGYAFQHIGETHLPTVVFCLGGIAIMLLLKKINKALPGALIVAVLGTLLVKFLGLDQKGIDIVKNVPEGLPAFQLPDWTMENIKAVFPTVLTVTVICIVECFSIAKVWEAKHKNYKIDANQELLALGVSKIASSFFQAIPTSGSFTRSAVNSESGAKSGMASIITVVLIGLTLLFLTPLFYFLPKAILAAIVLLSVKSLFDLKEAKHLWHTHRGDFFMMLLTFIITLVLGIEEGVLAGVVLSIVLVMYRSSQPHIAVLGQLPSTKYFRNITRFPEATQIPACAIVRFDSQLFFANALYFKEFIENLVETQSQPLDALILDASSIHDIDSSGLNALSETNTFLKSKEIKLYISDIIGPVRDRLYKAGLMDEIGKENQFMYLEDAVACYQKRNNNETDFWTVSAIQTNHNT